MAYIYLEELKEHLPVILSDWIEPGDESWEWIFQEIEQKCHVGKKKKDKKPKKKDIQNAMEIAIMAHRNDINELNDKISRLNDICNAHTVRLDRISQDITAAKSMAEIAKNRTETDYSKISSSNPTGNTDWAKAQAIIMICESNGITKPELESLDLILSKYIKNPHLKKDPSNNFSYADGKTTKEVKEIIDCMRCKHYCGEYVIKGPCLDCINYNCLEAKDDE